MQTLDYRLFFLAGKTIAGPAYLVTADIPYSGDKTVNGKYSDEERMENHWVSNDTDRIHRLAYDPGQAYPVKKIVLYHIKCNVLHDTGAPRFSAVEGFVQRDGQPRWNFRPG